MFQCDVSKSEGSQSQSLSGVVQCLHASSYFSMAVRILEKKPRPLLLPMPSHLKKNISLTTFSSHKMSKNIHTRPATTQSKFQHLWVLQLLYMFTDLGLLAPPTGRGMKDTHCGYFMVSISSWRASQASSCFSTLFRNVFSSSDVPSIPAQLTLWTPPETAANIHSHYSSRTGDISSLRGIVHTYRPNDRLTDWRVLVQTDWRTVVFHPSCPVKRTNSPTISFIIVFIMSDYSVGEFEHCGSSKGNWPGSSLVSVGLSFVAAGAFWAFLRDPVTFHLGHLSFQAWNIQNNPFRLD